MRQLEIDAAELPIDPGCYLFKNRKGTVLYVGKAQNVRARVRQYISGHDGRTMVPFLVRHAHRVEAIVTTTEKEALLLENNLIKQHQPRYNVKLRDDKNFLHLRIDLGRRWPRYHLVRRIKEDGAKYFGPYHSASRARKTLDFVQRAFPLRTCTDAVLNSRTRPCLLYQMNRCVGPCVDKVDADTYQQLAEDSMLVLSGQRKAAVKSLKKRMMSHAEHEEFEQAARLRDLIHSIESTIERQTVVDTRLGDRDVWGVYLDGLTGAIAVLPVREGVMGEPRATVIPSAVDGPSAILATALLQAYPQHHVIPTEILVPVLPENHATIEELLTERRQAKVQIRVPQRGPKVSLVELATKNAKVRFERDTDEQSRHDQAMERLAKVLELDQPPQRMECFDNSHIQGSVPVSAMSVFHDGRPARAEYRRYRIKRAKGGDDYAMMREVLERRFIRARESGEFPDLLVVDGGKGQLGVALAVLHDLGLHQQPVVGIAKPRTERRRGDRFATDKIVLPQRKDPIKLRSGDAALRILQHIRDEAHQTVVRYHRKLRTKASLTSLLEAIPGVGPARRKALLRHLGSLDDVADATVEQLAAVPGIGPALAQEIHNALNPTG